MIKRVGPRKWVVYSDDGKKVLSKPVSHARALQLDSTKSKG